MDRHKCCPRCGTLLVFWWRTVADPIGWKCTKDGCDWCVKFDDDRRRVVELEPENTDLRWALEAALCKYGELCPWAEGSAKQGTYVECLHPEDWPDGPHECLRVDGAVLECWVEHLLNLAREAREARERKADDGHRPDGADDGQAHRGDPGQVQGA